MPRTLEVNTGRWRLRNKRRTVRREVIQTESTKEMRAFRIKNDPVAKCITPLSSEINRAAYC